MKPHAKSCRKCRLNKSLEEFYRHKAMADGHLNFCKDCVRERVGKHRTGNLERIRAYDRKRGRTEKRLELNRLRARLHKKRYAHITKRWQEKNKLKRAAHIKLGNAVRSRKIKKGPCQICGTTLRIEAHHTDYSKPFDVVWLCYKHHREIHRKYKD